MDLWPPEKPQHIVLDSRGGASKTWLVRLIHTSYQDWFNNELPWAGLQNMNMCIILEIRRANTHTYSICIHTHAYASPPSRWALTFFVFFVLLPIIHHAPVSSLHSEIRQVCLQSSEAPLSSQHSDLSNSVLEQLWTMCWLQIQRDFHMLQIFSKAPQQKHW